MSESEGKTVEGISGAQPILVATDFSPDSDAALKWAGEYAEVVGAPILLLHVVHDPAEAAGFYQSEQGDAPASMSDAAAKMMAAYIDRMRNENPDLESVQNVESELVVGLPPGRIVEIAERDGARMVVIGSRGRTGLSHILVGSVAERVAHLAPMPVVIVKRSVGG